ncbi:unnamed protein product, partial [Didymodactylos carnosus]
MFTRQALSPDKLTSLLEKFENIESKLSAQNKRLYELEHNLIPSLDTKIESLEESNEELLARLNEQQEQIDNLKIISKHINKATKEPNNHKKKTVKSLAIVNNKSSTTI